MKIHTVTTTTSAPLSTTLQSSAKQAPIVDAETQMKLMGKVERGEKLEKEY